VLQYKDSSRPARAVASLLLTIVFLSLAWIGYADDDRQSPVLAPPLERSTTTFPTLFEKSPLLPGPTRASEPGIQVPLSPDATKDK